MYLKLGLILGFVPNLYFSMRPIFVFLAHYTSGGGRRSGSQFTVLCTVYAQGGPWFTTMRVTDRQVEYLSSPTWIMNFFKTKTYVTRYQQELLQISASLYYFPRISWQLPPTNKAIKPYLRFLPSGPSRYQSRFREREEHEKNTCIITFFCGNDRWSL